MPTEVKLIPNYCQHPVYWDPRIHLLYVLDSRRVEAFAAAISEVVRPGMVVADVGTGTGILARLAVAAGARRVYAIDRHWEILEIARRANEQLQMCDRIVLIRGDATRVGLPEPADVIVSELIGSIGNDEGIGAILCAARRNWLRDGTGQVVPSHLDAFFAPVDLRGVWQTMPKAYRGDVLVAPEQRPPLFGACYEVLGLQPSQLLAHKAVLDTIDVARGDGNLRFTTESLFRLTGNGTLSGLAAWFSARLSETVVLDTSPWAPSTCWGQAFFPFPRQIPVLAGDTLAVRFAGRPLPSAGRPYYTWQARLLRGAKTVAALRASNLAAVRQGERALRARLRRPLPTKLVRMQPARCCD